MKRGLILALVLVSIILISGIGGCVPEAKKQVINDETPALATLSENIFKAGNMTATPEEISAVIKSLQKFNEIPEATEKISFWLEEIATYKAKSKEELVATANWISDKSIVDCAYKLDNANALGEIAFRTYDKEATIAAAQCICTFAENPEIADIIEIAFTNIAANSKIAVINSVASISKFEKMPYAAEGIAISLGKISYYSGNKEDVIAAASWLSEESVINAVTKFENTPEIAGKVASALGEIVYFEKNKDVMLSAASLLSNEAVKNDILVFKEDPEIAGNTINSLSWIAVYTQSEKATIEAANCISKFKETPERVKFIGSKLAKIAESTKSEQEVINAAIECTE